MIAVVGGLGAAFCFTISALCATASSRRIGAASTLAWFMTIGLLLIALPVVVLANAGQLRPQVLLLLTLAGGTNVAGLFVEYAAMRRGKVGVVTAIASTEGLVATLLSAVFGTPIGGRIISLLVIVTIGVVLAALHPDVDTAADGSGSGDGSAGSLPRVRSAVLAIPAALLFGVTLYATGRAGAQVSVLWVLLPARVFGTALVTVPLWARQVLSRQVLGRPMLVSPRRVLPLVLVGGAAEVLGIWSYAVGARHDLAVAAVLSAQFAAMIVVAAYFVFHEHLVRTQLVGLVVIAVGVVALSAG